MSLVLVDTSVWIGFFRDENIPEVRKLSALLDNGQAVCLCPTIIQEILQGISDSRNFDRIKEHLLRQIVLTCDPVESAIGAAKIYQHLRKKGVTIRKSNDCLIAYHALYYEASVLHTDRDYKNIAAHTGLQLF
jgi:predicted nucleic acid-binding protein